MLYREIIAVCSQIHTKHIHTLCGQNVEFVDVKPGDAFSDHWAASFILTVILSNSMSVCQSVTCYHMWSHFVFI